jgi:hypothetical protein
VTVAATSGTMPNGPFTNTAHALRADARASRLALDGPVSTSDAELVAKKRRNGSSRSIDPEPEALGEG